MKRAVALVIFVLVVFFAVVFSTFYGSNSSVKSVHNEEEEKTQLTFMNSWGGSDSKAKALEEILADFEEKNTDIDVINKSTSSDDFLPSIKDSFATGDQPDVFGLWPGSDIRSLIAAGKVADLTALINSDPEWKSSFGDDMWNLVEENGKIYGMPVEITFEGLFINKDLFDKYHVEVPKDYTGLVKAINAFKSHKIIPIAFNCKPEGSYIYQNIAMSLGGKKLEHPIINGEVCEPYIEAMKTMKDLFNMGAFPPSNECFSMESTERDDLFLNKKAAMIVQGSWFIEKCNDKDVELVAFPRMSSSKNTVYGLGGGTFYISQKAWEDTSKREQAIKLLKYLTSKEACAQLGLQTEMISNVDISDYNINYNSLTQSGLSIIKDSDVLVGPPDHYFSRTVWESIIVRDFPDMLSGSISPEDLWKEAIKADVEDK